MTPAEIERLASAFWDRVGGYPAPPRDLEPLIPLHLGAVFVTALPAVSRVIIRDWLNRRPGIPAPPGSDDPRPAFGCVVAYRGLCAIFIDCTLSPALRRVIVAHELGHYLAEYEWPRQRLIRRLGPSVRPVLDGERPPSNHERWAAQLAGVTFGVHTHYLDREYNLIQDSQNYQSEALANAMALELLAPASEILMEAPDPIATRTVQTLLVDRYGLPPDWARGYAGQITALAKRRVPASRRWGL
ncbi:MAG: hypothetical protein LC104_14455 [Bacteroidales bacterium]|nr:hypothetical protein [Bacteroidales bacterium]